MREKTRFIWHFAILFVPSRRFILNNMMYKTLFNQRKALRFRQFTRKGYALFACLGRVVTIGVLSVATLRSAAVTTTDTLSVAGATVVSDSIADSPDKEATLDGVEVTGSRAPLALGQAARMVTVLSREEIQAAPVQSINDLLKMAVGVDVRQRGPIGAQTDIGIRGSTSEQIIDADQIYVLQQGRVVQHGSPDEVYRQGGVYKDIFDASARSMNVDKIASTINI